MDVRTFTPFEVTMIMHIYANEKSDQRVIEELEMIKSELTDYKKRLSSFMTTVHLEDDLGIRIKKLKQE